MNKVLSKNIAGMIFVKAIAMIVNFSMIPLYLYYFNDDKGSLGQWLVFFTLLTILITFDFGVSNRLKNDLLSSEKKWEKKITRAMMTNSFIGLCVVTILFVLRDINAIDYLSQVDSNYFNVTLVFLLVLSPFKVSVPILQAKQRNWFSAFIIIVPQIVIFIYLVFFKHFGIGEYGQDSILLYTLCISNLICYSGCFFYLFRKYKLTIDYDSLKHPRVIDYSKNSFTFFVAQIALILLITMNDVIYGILGLEHLVVDYQYYFRVYSLIFVSFSSITVPFWSAIRYQYVNHDYVAVERLSLYLYALLVPIFIVILIIGFGLQYVFDLWLGYGKKIVDFEYVILFSILSFSMCLMYVFTALLNSFDEIEFQAKTLLYASMIKYIIIFFGVYIDFDYDLIILSTVMSMVFVALLVSYKAIRVSKNLEA
ncbi:TPA: hypothetical protein I7751_20175 [Vibrio vulnificus]|nr:hypothetical protein [Vibrio vulnificus]